MDAFQVDAKTDLGGYQWAAEALFASGTKSSGAKSACQNSKDSGSFSDAFDAKAQASKCRQLFRILVVGGCVGVSRRCWG